MPDKIEVISTTDRCQDFERPGCLGTPDERYIIRFDDIGEDPIMFCAFCGPKNMELQEALERAFALQGPEFSEKFEKAVQEAEEVVKRRNS